MMYTSYFAKIKHLPKDMIPVSICSRHPTWYSGLCYGKLAPTHYIRSEFRHKYDVKLYTELFNDHVLSLLHPEQVVSDLYSLTGCKNVVLVCYETPTAFCHRHLVRDWLIKNGSKCEEIIW